MRNLIVGILFCAFLMSFAGASGYAQSDPCQHWATGVPGNPFPAGFGPWNCYLIEFVGYTCAVHTCPPPDPCISPCCCPPGGSGSGSSGSSAGAPINLLTGDTYIEETDVRIPGLSNGLTLTRTWNSKWPALQTAYQLGLFGP